MLPCFNIRIHRLISCHCTSNKVDWKTKKEGGNVSILHHNAIASDLNFLE